MPENCRRHRPFPSRPAPAGQGCHDIIPGMLADCRVFAYPFRDENRKAAAYWRYGGTLDAYYQANMDLIQIDPHLNLRAVPVIRAY